MSIIREMTETSVDLYETTRAATENIATFALCRQNPKACFLKCFCTYFDIRRKPRSAFKLKLSVFRPRQCTANSSFPL